MLYTWTNVILYANYTSIEKKKNNFQWCWCILDNFNGTGSYNSKQESDYVIKNTLLLAIMLCICQIRATTTERNEIC